MFPTLSFGDQEITPPDLAIGSAKAADVLASIGIAEGDTFAVMLRNSPTLIEIMLAARQIGAYFVPLNWHFKTNEAGYILRDSGAKALVINGDLLAQICKGIPPGMLLLEVKPDSGADVQRDFGHYFSSKHRLVRSLEAGQAACQSVGPPAGNDSLHIRYDWTAKRRPAGSAATGGSDRRRGANGAHVSSRPRHQAGRAMSGFSTAVPQCSSIIRGVRLTVDARSRQRYAAIVMRLVLRCLRKLQLVLGLRTLLTYHRQQRSL